MTLAAIWRVRERIWSIADTRISSPSGVLTDHGPKLLPIAVVLKQPGPSGFFDQVIDATTVGFAYAGATLPALSTQALGNALFQNLIGPPTSQPPGLDEIANAVAKIARRYVLEVGQRSGTGALFESIVFGYCFKMRNLRAFTLKPNLRPSEPLSIDVTERDLGSPENLVVIGTQPELLESRVRQEHLALREQPEPLLPDIQAVHDLGIPRRALKAIINEQANPAIGGGIQEAWVTRDGFTPVSTLVPIERLPSGKNATLTTLGFDLDEFDHVGQYLISMIGQA